MDGSSQIRANATPGCDANPRTILCKTDSTRCSDVTVTAKESSGSAANGGVDIPTALSPIEKRESNTSVVRWAIQWPRTRPLCLRSCLFGARFRYFWLHPDTLVLLSGRSIAAILARSIPKSRLYHRPIVSFSGFWCHRLIASDPSDALSEFFAGTDQPRKQGEVALRAIVRIGFASDYLGFERKEHLRARFARQGHVPTDFSTGDPDQPDHH